MYEKFGYLKGTYTADKLYLKGTYFIIKKILSVFLYHPILKQLLQYKIHIGYLHKEGEIVIDEKDWDIIESNEQYKSKLHEVVEDMGDGQYFVQGTNVQSLKNYLPSSREEFEMCTNYTIVTDVLTDDLTNDLKKYAKDFKLYDNNVYIYAEALYKGQLLPSFYSLLAFYNYEKTSKNTINKLNFKDFYKDARDEISYILQSDIKDFYVPLRDNFVNLVQEYLTKQIIDEDAFATLAKEIKKLDKNKDYSIYYYYKQVFKDFYNYILSEKKYIVCKKCGRLTKYTKTKIACSEKCRISLKNHRNYMTRKLSEKI